MLQVLAIIIKWQLYVAVCGWRLWAECSHVSTVSKYIQGTALVRSPMMRAFCFHYSLVQLRKGFGPLAQWSRLSLTEFTKYKARNLGEQPSAVPCTNISTVSTAFQRNCDKKNVLTNSNRKSESSASHHYYTHHLKMSDNFSNEIKIFTSWHYFCQTIVWVLLIKNLLS